MCSVAATAILLAAALIPTYEASAQIIPSSPQSSLLPENLFQSSSGLLSQDATDLAKNSTITANITQLATVLPIADQPITPPITAVNEASDESDETSSSDNDDDDENNSSSSNDNDDDDTGNDDSDDDDSDDDDSGNDNNDGDGGSSAASGGAFAIVS
jgi:hypothetical protein